MVPQKFMVVAGEASGDLLAAELVESLRSAFPGAFAPRFFGAGGPRMAQAGVRLVATLTDHAVVGLWEIGRHYLPLRRAFHQLVRAAMTEEPDVIVFVDFSGFNLRLADAIRQESRRARGSFWNWSPRMVYYVSPQVWASRDGRLRRIERDIDLLLCILPFEKDWYQKRTSALRVEFVGHPIVQRHADRPARPDTTSSSSRANEGIHTVVLLPGSRRQELLRHLPILKTAAHRMVREGPVRWQMVLPEEDLIPLAQQVMQGLPHLSIRSGRLADALQEADLAIASSGTVTLECAYFGVPTVVLYKTAWPTYWIGRRLAKVPFLAMPNLLAGEEIYPEFIQADAKPKRIARAALDLLELTERRLEIKTKLQYVIRSLGPPGAPQRAAELIYQSVQDRPDALRAGLESANQQT